MNLADGCLWQRSARREYGSVCYLVVNVQIASKMSVDHARPHLSDHGLDDLDDLE